MKAIDIPKYKATIRVHDLSGIGTPLVFVHGLGGASSYDYPGVVRDVSLRERRVVLIDLFGSGFSDRPVDFSYSISDHAAVVVDIVNRLELRKLHLFGHSMGGSVAISAATNLEPVLTSLILSEPNLDPGGGAFSRAIAARSEQQYCHDSAGFAESAPFAVHRAATSLVEGTTPSWREKLLQLSVPRTVLFGERSLPDTDYDKLPELGINVGCIPNAGHSMALENPSGLASAIAGALRATEQAKAQ